MDSLETASLAASAGGEITVLPAFVGNPDPQIVRVFPDRVAVNTGWIVHHESLRDTSRVRTVTEALLAVFQARESRFFG